MARFDLTDFEWSVIQPLLPNKPRGVPRVDDRRVLNGIFWRFFNKLKHFRGVAKRYDKRPENYLAGVKLASARIWMRANESIA